MAQYHSTLEGIVECPEHAETSWRLVRGATYSGPVDEDPDLFARTRAAMEPPCPECGQPMTLTPGSRWEPAY